MLFKLVLVSDRDEHLKDSLKMFKYSSNISHFNVVDGILNIYDETSLFKLEKASLEKIPFPSKNPEYIFQFIKSWLIIAQYPREPDHDGSNGKGFEITIDSGNGFGYNIIQVKPYWIEYHK